MTKVQQLTELLEPLIEDAGYECVEITFEKNGSDWVLTAYIDKDGEDISLDDCQKVSEILSPFLDEKDPIEQSYYLEVSSPGIDRPLKSEKDYLRNIGNKIELKTYVKKDGKKQFEGILNSFENDEVTLDCDGNLITFKLDEIAKANPAVEF